MYETAGPASTRSHAPHVSLPRYACDQKGPTFAGVDRPPLLHAYPAPRRRVDLLFIGWNPPKPFGGFWSGDSDDNLREELHGILRGSFLRSPRPDAEFLAEFLHEGFYFIHAVKCWSAAKFPGFGRGATPTDRRERGEPLLKACAAAHLSNELADLDPRKICALGEVAYCALREVQNNLDLNARPTRGDVFRFRDRPLLYTCFPSGSFVLQRRLREYTHDHVRAFLSTAGPVET